MPLCAEEQNAWPVSVRQTRPDGTLESGQYIGPFFFTKSTPAGELQGFRPLLLQARAGDKESDYFLYPLFTWEKQTGFSSFSFFQLINRRRSADAAQPEVRSFDVWPFYFSKETGDPATTYHALFPIAGTIKQRLGYDRLHFILFPLYLQTEQAGVRILNTPRRVVHFISVQPEMVGSRVTHAPWPFLRFIDGDGHHGFEFWPLFGHRGRAGDYDKQFWLWPLFYRQATQLGEPQPTVRIGALPFYTRDTAPGLVSENYVWPFFGYTHRTEPVRYDERRYLWPFLVQGRGEQRYVNRWAPLYTHSNYKGHDKTWIVWPLYRHAEWQDEGIAQEKNQLLYFLYWSQTQRSLANPAAAPAHKTHFWPLLSVWNNGAGRRQVQFLSPLEVFFPTNDPIRQLYTPLFALYRYDRQSDTASRHSLLWNALTYRRSATDREFHLGPLFSVNSGAATKRIALLRGVLGWQRRPGEARGRFFLFDFARKTATPSTAIPSP
jgi:hypothetical protein